MTTGPRYVVWVGERGPFAVAWDEESQRGLWLLIAKYGLCETAARALLDDGQMIVAGDLMAVREDVMAEMRKPA